MRFVLKIGLAVVCGFTVTRWASAEAAFSCTVAVQKLQGMGFLERPRLSLTICKGTKPRSEGHSVYFID